MSITNLFKENIPKFASQSNEIFSQLYFLQIHCVNLFMEIMKEKLINKEEFLTLFRLFVEVSPEIYYERDVNPLYVLQFNSQLLRKLGDHEKKQFSSRTIVGLLSLRMIEYLPKGSTLVSEILSATTSEDYENIKLDSTALCQAYIEQPFITSTLLNIINYKEPTKELFYICIGKMIETCETYEESCWKLLQFIGQCVTSVDLDMNSVNLILSLTEKRKCLRKHMLMEIELALSSEQRSIFSISLRHKMTQEIIELYGPVPDKIVDIHEQLCFCLFIAGFPLTFYDVNSAAHVGWLILLTHHKGIASLLLNVIKILIEARLLDVLKTILGSPHLSEFNQFLLVNIWHPNLADETTMGMLLELCYQHKPTEIQSNSAVEQLCLKIKTRWDTLKKFNQCMSSINNDQETTTQDILTLTTVGNTSHLMLVSGLPDPTGLDYKVVLDLLDRTGSNIDETFNCLASDNLPLETERIEESCDKSIFYCSVSIRKLWECLVLFSPIDTRERVCEYLQKRNLMTKVEIISAENSFCYKFRSALKSNDLSTCQELYKFTVVPRLEYLIAHIDIIIPLSLRLELLENLYSMLYITEFDLFGGVLTGSSQSNFQTSNWPLPETIVKEKSDSELDNDNISLHLDNNRYVCPFFLFKDVLVILDSNLAILKSLVSDKSAVGFLQQKIFDTKVAQVINYPNQDEIDVRINDLLTSIGDVKWRIDLLTTNSFGINDSSIGIFNIPICVISDKNSHNLKDISRMKSKIKYRQKSNSSVRKGQQKSIKERISSLGDEKDNSHTELSSKIMQLGIIQNQVSWNHNLPSHQLKDTFKLFSPKSISDVQEILGFGSTDDGEHHLSKSFDYQESTKISHGNYQFLTDCIPLIKENIYYLTISVLNSGKKLKAQQIYQKYGHLKNNNSKFDELMSEIKYWENFDSLTSKLSMITTPDVTLDLVVSKDSEQVPFGKFNWSKLSALNVKLSSKKENEIAEIVNELFTLNSRGRPSMKFDQPLENLSKEFINREIKHFNCGLLFDIAITGSKTKWQLCQILTLIESHFNQFDSSDFDPGTKGIDHSKYHKMQGLTVVIKDLIKSVNVDMRTTSITFSQMEMNSLIDTNYSFFMDKWFNQLQASINSLQFNESECSDDLFINDETKTRWSYLGNLISMIKETCAVSDDKETPFKYLVRPLPLYLDSLYSHLEVFATFLAKYKNSSSSFKNKNQNNIVQLQHEFSVLKLSPLSALGELIFLKSEDPLSREMLQISKDLGLNISAVVLENCIPTISSYGKEFSLEVEESSFVDRKMVYNASTEAFSEIMYNLDPIYVVTGCLDRIIKILLKNTCPVNENSKQTNQIDQQSWKVLLSPFSVFSNTSADTSSSESSSKTKDSGLRNSRSKNKCSDTSLNTVLSSNWRVLMILSHDEDWLELLVSDIVDLEHVNLDLLKTNNEKLAFFINLYNLMMIHMIVLLAEGGRTSLKFRSFETKLMRSNFCYKVGQIGVISMEHISQYYLDIPDVTFSELYMNLAEISSPLPTVEEQLYRTNGLNCQNMAIFGMIDGTVSGHPLKIYYPETVIKDLQNNLSYIIKYKTTYEAEKRQIFLPQIFKWYTKLILAGNSELKHKLGPEDSKITTESNADEVLIRRILNKCSDKVARKFSLLLRLDTDTIIHNIKDQTSNKLLKIIWQTRSETIGCNFLSKRDDIVSNISNTDENTDQSAFNSLSSAVYQTSFPLPNYQPTIEAINHLRDRSPLLACLAYLTIGDDFVIIPTHVSDDDTSSNLNTHKSRSISSVQMEDKLSEIRSYKYSRIVNNYPAIGNWIKNFWSEWLISRNSGQCLDINVSPVTDTLVLYCCSNVPMEIRWAAFTHPLTENLDQILIDYAINIMSRDSQGFLNIGSALRMIQSQTMANSLHLQRLLDIILEKSARFWANGLIINTNSRRHLPPDNTNIDNDSFKLQEDRLLNCIYAMKDKDLLFKESIRYLDLLNIDNALKLMEFNYNLRPDHAKEEQQKQIVILRIFKRIHNLVITCQNKCEFWEKAQIPTEFLDWHRLQNISENEPDLVLKFLIRQHQFDLAKCWCQFYLPDDGEQKVEAEYLVSLVGEDNDKQKIVELVSHISKLHREKKPEDFMKVIHHVIGHSEAPFAIILICAYAIKCDIFKDFESVNGVSMCDWQDRVHRSWVGASMLRALTSDVIQEQYSQLVQHPHLIMEQLIMNAEINVFRKMMDIYKEQKKAYFSIKKQPCGTGLHRTYSQESGYREEFIPELEPGRINALLTEYICKALELSAVRGEEGNDLDDVFTSSKHMDSKSSFASLHPDIISSSESNCTIIPNGRDSNYSFDTKSVGDPFSMPVVPPPQHKWFKDSDASKCMCCTKEKFSMFNRRHHCRRCGRVICAQCSTHRTPIEGVTARICNDCFHVINSKQESMDRARHGNILLENQQICSGTELLYSRHNFPYRSESTCSIPNFDQNESLPVNMLQLGVGALENGWRLGTDPVENETIRQMFYYDDAPSVTIAFCLADFHSNSNVCGNLLLDRVEYLADFLKPMKNHLPNPEVDYLLVLDIGKQIAYKAKLKFSNLNNDVDFDRAENYLSRLDLLSVLVKSNCCNYLPSFSDGSKFIDKIQSLRDRLIREERLELAGVVSNKAGLSNDPVFVAMGLRALEDGKYDEARKLFSSCSKTGRYESQSTSVLPYPVNEIMKILDGNKLSVQSTKEMLSNIIDSEDLLKMPDLKFREQFEISRKQIEETIYYLDTYNAPLQCLQFLCRQQMWSKATDYVFKKNVSREVFIEGLISPAINTGHFSSVKSEIFMKEGGITSWKTYYESLCKFLDKKGCYDDLLEFQEKMNDHFQAARTLTNYFYLRGAQSYQALREKIGFLEKAQRHLEIFISKREKDPKFELQKYTNNLILIKQQIEATLFLTDPITIGHHQANMGYLVQHNIPPTLFGTPDAIVDLCLTILFCRPNLSDGLQKLCPFMTQCHIYAEKILPKAAIRLLQHPKTINQSSDSESETAGVTAVLDLCTYISTYYRLDSRKNDEVLLAIMPVIPLSLLSKSNMVNRFINLFKSEAKKIDAYIAVKDFKRAFSNAVRLGYLNEVQRILELAEASNDISGVIELCKQWLSQNKGSTSMNAL